MMCRAMKLETSPVRRLTGDAMIAEVDRLELVRMTIAADPTQGAGMSYQCPLCRRVFYLGIMPNAQMELTGDHNPAKACAAAAPGEVQP